ncbi:MAG: hypothetical protein FH758_11550 [Firmicutes bacterium]|nr:hypothetical protein [Bacillota bacterium]
MLNSNSIKLFLIIAVIAIFWGVQISLINFNNNAGFTPPVQTVSLQETNKRWQLSLLDHSIGVEKQQLSQLTQIATETGKRIPVGIYMQAEESIRTFAGQLGNKWQQVINEDTFETVRCWADDLVTELDNQE